MTGVARYWAVIPAAGVGSRMRSEVPKQYLKIHGKCILEYSLECFCNHQMITGVVTALAENDDYWSKLPAARHEKIMTTTGGTERFHSVLNGLRYLTGRAGDDDWVLVHDAVRPCLNGEDIDKLINVLGEHPVGGLLAFPAGDTMKRGNNKNEVIDTVDRKGLWHALTPQMFRFRMLLEAIEKTVNERSVVTDEAQAIELCGNRPVLVQGRAENIKITHRVDLSLAEVLLSEREMVA